MAVSYHPGPNGYSFSLFTLPGATTAVAYGINDLGNTTGISSIGSFIDNRGSITAVVVPFTGPIPLAINNLDQVVGFFPKSDGGHAFIDTNGTITYPPLASSAVNDGRATGINDLGQVVGQYTGYSGSSPETITLQFGFIDTNGTVTHLALANGGVFLPTGISDFDSIVGSTTAGLSGVLDLKADKFVPVEVPGAKSTDATAINNLGQIAGTYTDSNGQVRGFVDTYGHFSFLNLPTSMAGTLEAITSINDLGQVVGNMIANGVTESFIASPCGFSDLLADLKSPGAPGLDHQHGIGAPFGLDINTGGAATPIKPDHY
jgi:uncharacterized membrane protein